jgi:hypothetical protein
MTDPHLPDGVIKLPVAPNPESEGCGVRGCLYVVVALFALLLIALVLVAVLRQWPTPMVQP